MTHHFDLIVIGGGPAGYVGAIRAAQMGLNVACVEKYDTLGGTCLNVGCIPSKTLLHSAHIYKMVQEETKDLGINVGKVGLDLKTMMANKDKIVRTLTQGIAFLFKKNNITHLTGVASFVDGHTLQVSGHETPYSADKFLIGTGSVPLELPFLPYNQTSVVDSTGALSLKKVPSKMAVIGGGVIGVELGSVWHDLGADVTVVTMDNILHTMDKDVSKYMRRHLDKIGVHVHTQASIVDAQVRAKSVDLVWSQSQDDARIQEKFDMVLVACGRVPYTEGLSLDKASVATDDKGFIVVNESYQCAGASHIYAVGDVIGGAMLAHVAEEEAIYAVEHMAGGRPYIDHVAFPCVVYTTPEIASVGALEQDLEADGVAYKVGMFPFKANSRAIACGVGKDGFVKTLADEATNRLLGMHIVGPAAGELIQEAVTIMAYKGSVEDIAMICHGHPNYCEAVKESALDALGRVIHM